MRHARYASTSVPTISNTFTGFEGYDPEVGMTGIYSGGYPRLRKWTFGADFTF